ncbi:hypothetical protein [Streptomyces qinglanensis]|uniref:Uncharacterized protein n=1 Tax=Streptomyces qinglanensis TaxID=943816 RepID=A0A1H9NA47_9ACTN|nr:hypothetical protein [Streptomyces qinglanensis]SER32273.1 hypothetical protein SAMN05421870_101192 [Streptomyces qinglanensis]
MSNQHAEHTPDRQDGQAEHAEHAEQVETLEAFYTDVKRLGHWTRSRTIEVRTRRASVHLDLRSAQIPAGEIELRLHSERSTLKLLLPEDAVLQESGLALAGRCKIKDRERHAEHSGRVVRLTGTLQHSEIRVARGGVATLSAMFSREFLDDARTAHRDGTEPVLPDPGKEHGTP